MIRIGFLGAGFIARYHAFQLESCAEPHQVVAVHDPAAHRAERFAEWQNCDVAPTIDAVLDACDAVFVCTWTSEHLPAVRAAVERGRAVFCEKPLSVDLAHATELTDLVERAGVVNEVGLVLRSVPVLLALRELIRAPESGRVMNVVFRDDQFIPTQGMYRSTWRGDPARAGSGTLLEHSIHDLDILEWLFGSIESVAAHTAQVHGIEGIEDSVSALVRFESGASATLTSVWHDVLARPSQRRMEVFCERALLTLEGDTFGPVRWERDDDFGTIEGDGLVAWLQSRNVSMESAEETFLRAVAGHGPASPTVTDALRAHVIADAIYRSAASGGASVGLER
jgi:myo-inositol 2-dehydrogenase/D-chiro-inositol 1-dehydrogenase